MLHCTFACIVMHFVDRVLSSFIYSLQFSFSYTSAPRLPLHSKSLSLTPPPPHSTSPAAPLCISLSRSPASTLHLTGCWDPYPSLSLPRLHSPPRLPLQTLSISLTPPLPARLPACAAPSTSPLPPARSDYCTSTVGSPPAARGPAVSAKALLAAYTVAPARGARRRSAPSVAPLRPADPAA